MNELDQNSRTVGGREAGEHRREASPRQLSPLLHLAHLLWRRRLLIAAGSLVPALLVAALLMAWPRKYTATFVYEHPITESEYNVLVRRFYSLENLDKVASQLREKGLSACAQDLLDCKSEGSLEKLIRLTASPAYPKRLQTTDPATSEKISAFQAQLLSIRITGRSRQEVETVAAVVTDNFEHVLPMYVMRNDLKEAIRRFETMAADIENNRFMLDLDLQREQARLEKLRALATGQTPANLRFEIPDSNAQPRDSAAGSGGEAGLAGTDHEKIVLQFSDVKGSREFLPLPYQVRAIQSKIVDLQETIQGNEDRYTYYTGVLKLANTLLDQVEKSILTQYTVQQFLDFVDEQLRACEDKAQGDYLKAYMRRTENLVFVSTRAGENPVIYPVPKHLAGTSLLVFIVSLMAVTFVAVMLEYPRGQLAWDRP